MGEPVPERQSSLVALIRQNPGLKSFLIDGVVSPDTLVPFLSDRLPSMQRMNCSKYRLDLYVAAGPTGESSRRYTQCFHQFYLSRPQGKAVLAAEKSSMFGTIETEATSKPRKLADQWDC